MSKRYDEAIEVTPDPLSSGDSAGGNAAGRWRSRGAAADTRSTSSWHRGARGPSGGPQPGVAPATDAARAIVTVTECSLDLPEH